MPELMPRPAPWFRLGRAHELDAGAGPSAPLEALGEARGAGGGVPVPAPGRSVRASELAQGLVAVWGRARASWAG
jgi:hypothetical protein